MTRHPWRTGVAYMAAFAVSLSGLLLPAAPAKAHAGVAFTAPTDGSALKTAPSTLRIGFTEIVSFSPSNVQLLNGLGTQIPLTVSGSNSTRTTVTATPQRKLAPGRYALRWSVTSQDGHVVAGAVAFTVNKRTVKAEAQTITLSNGVRATLNGAKPGSRTVTLATASRTGTLTLTHAKLGAPLRWAIKGDGKKATARGVLPFSGEWSVSAELIGQGYDTSTGTGTFTLSSG